MTPNSPPPDANGYYAVTVDANAFANDDLATRLRKRESAVREILVRTPAAAQETMRETLRALEDPSIAMAMTHKDPEIARLLGVIHSIHHASAAAGRSAAIGAKPRGKSQVISVEIALVPELLPLRVRARVIRRPDDCGVPIVLLRESQATATDLQMALRMAVSQYKKHGKTPARATKKDFVAKPRGASALTPERLAKAEKDLVWLRAQAPKNIPGVGPAKLMQVATLLNPPAPPRP